MEKDMAHNFTLFGFASHHCIDSVYDWHPPPKDSGWNTCNKVSGLVAPTELDLKHVLLSPVAWSYMGNETMCLTEIQPGNRVVCMHFNLVYVKNLLMWKNLSYYSLNLLYNHYMMIKNNWDCIIFVGHHGPSVHHALTRRTWG